MAAGGLKDTHRRHTAIFDRRTIQLSLAEELDSELLVLRFKIIRSLNS